MRNQRTIKNTVSISGIGLHSGKRATVTLVPAKSNVGIKFVRMDLPHCPEILGNVRNVTSTVLATTISTGTAKVSTVEHLMSALWATGIDNVICQLDGEEVPILDGSAIPFVQLIKKAGIKTLRSSRKYLVVKDTIELRLGNKWAILRPSQEFRIRYAIDFPHPLIGKQVYEFHSLSNFEKEIAPCRTFGFLKDVQKMQAMGLALGGSLHNAVVLDEEKALNPEGLKFDNEFVRHKILDAIGDFSLLGYQILGEVELHRAGHELQTKLIQTLLERPNAYSIISAVPAQDSSESSAVARTAAHAI